MSHRSPCAWFAALALVPLLALPSACTDGGSTGPPGGDGTANDGTDGGNQNGTGEIVYQGTAATTITYLDDTGGLIETKSYATAMEVILDDPVEANGTPESNPLQLVVGSLHAHEATDEGHYSIWSAQSFTDAQDNVEYILQWWALERQGNAITGTLVDHHTAEAMALNLINAWADAYGVPIVWPFVMTNGTTLQGTITDSQVALRFEGSSTGGTRRFVSDLTATR